MATKKSKATLSPYDETDWRAEDDLRILMSAKAINKDAKRYKAACELAKTKMMHMASVAGESEPDGDE
jgi:hypothetical protein